MSFSCSCARSSHEHCAELRICPGRRSSQGRGKTHGGCRCWNHGQAEEAGCSSSAMLQKSYLSFWAAGVDGLVEPMTPAVFAVGCAFPLDRFLRTFHLFGRHRAPRADPFLPRAPWRKEGAMGTCYCVRSEVVVCRCCQSLASPSPRSGSLLVVGGQRLAAATKSDRKTWRKEGAPGAFCCRRLSLPQHSRCGYWPCCSLPTWRLVIAGRTASGRCATYYQWGCSWCTVSVPGSPSSSADSGILQYARCKTTRDGSVFTLCATA